MTWQLVNLGDVCQQDRCSIKPGQSEELPYLGLECIESGTGQLLTGAMSKTPESPQANSFQFDSRHVLYGKLRPYLNKVALPEATGKCSTEIIPLLPNDGVDRRYLAYFLRSPSTVNRISETVSGARMPRADMNMVFGLKMPLPPLKDQQHIVDLLTRAEGIVRLRREAAAKAAELIPAIFIDMFGDPAQTPVSDKQKIGDLLQRSIRNGISPSKSGRYVGRVLTLSAITRGRFNPEAIKESTFDEPISLGDSVSNEDFLVCRGNGNKSLVGAGCFPTRTMADVAFPDTAIAIRPNLNILAPSYLEALWKTSYLRQQIDAIAKTTNGTFKINQSGLASIVIPVPSMDLQLRFGEQVDRVQSILSQQSEAEAKAQATFNALVAQAFAPHGSL